MCCVEVQVVLQLAGGEFATHWNNSAIKENKHLHILYVFRSKENWGELIFAYPTFIVVAVNYNFNPTWNVFFCRIRLTIKQL